MVSIYLLAVKLMYLALAKRALELFDCSYDASESFFFEIEPTRQCFTSQWWQLLLPWSIMAILVFVIGFPSVTAFMILYRYRVLKKPVHTRKPWESFLLQVTYKKQNEFRHGHDFWPVVISIRQLLLASVQLFFTDYAPFQAVLVILVYLFGLVLQLVVKPYSLQSLNFLESATLFSSIIVLLGLLLLFVLFSFLFSVLLLF